MRTLHNILRYVALAITAAFCISTAAAQATVKTETAANLSAKADSAYNSKDYTEAADLYKTIIKEYGVSSDLYYNLGNTYFRMGKVSQSVLAYERALKIDPSNKDARANLDFVNTTLEDKPEDNSSILGKIHSGVIAMMSPNAWAWTAFILFVIITGLVAAYLFLTNVTVRKVGFFGSMVLFIVFVYATIVAYQSAAAADNNDVAIVTAPSANLTPTPSAKTDKTDKIVPVHEGTRLVIIDSVNAAGSDGAQLWYHVKVNNTTAAWIDASNVERI